MNLLFERIRLQARIRDLIDRLGTEQAQLLVVQALNREVRADEIHRDRTGQHDPV